MEWGELGTGPGQFDLVHGVAVDRRRRVFVADRKNNRVQVFTMSGFDLHAGVVVGRANGRASSACAGTHSGRPSRPRGCVSTRTATSGSRCGIHGPTARRIRASTLSRSSPAPGRSRVHAGLRRGMIRRRELANPRCRGGGEGRAASDKPSSVNPANVSLYRAIEEGRERVLIRDLR